MIEMKMGLDVAYTLNSSYYSVYEKGKESQGHKTKNIHIWAKDPEVNWKLHVDIWNRDLPLEQATRIKGGLTRFGNWPFLNSRQTCFFLKNMLYFYEKSG
jgi:hypothetical protein